MKYSFFFLLLFICTNVIGQSKYLVDSFIYSDNITNEIYATTYYLYNDKDQINRIESDNSFINYTYPTDSTRIIEAFTYDNPSEYFIRNFDIMDEYGFIKIRTTSTFEEDMDKVTVIDTNYRTEEGTTYFRRRYKLNEDQLKIDILANGYLNDENLLDSIETNRYSSVDGSIISNIKSKYIYNSNQNRTLAVTKVESVNSRIDSIEYSYENNQLTYSLTKKYIDGMLDQCSKLEYTSDTDKATTTNYLSIDCEEFTIDYSLDQWLSSNDLFLYDSTRLDMYDVGLDSNYNLITYEGDFTNNEALYVDQNDIRYQQGELSLNRQRQRYYHINPSYVGIIETKLANFTTFPNPSSAYSSFVISSDSKFDQVEIYSVEGQLVKRIKTSVKSKMLLDSPMNSGVYFVILLKEGIQISIPKQISIIN